MPASSRFRAQFFANQTAEWEDQYVEYDRLLKLVEYERNMAKLNCSFASTSARSLAGPLDPGSMSSLDEHYPLYSGSFSATLHDEMDKVTAFASQRLEESQKHLAEIVEYSTSEGHDPNVLRKALVEQCRAFMMLLNYCNVNSAAVYDLAQRRSKVFNRLFIDKLEKGQPKFMVLADGVIPDHINQITAMHAHFFTNGDITEAVADLQKRRQAKPMKFWGVFFLGLYVGLCVPITLLIIGLLSVNPIITDEFGWDRVLKVVPIFRAGLLMCITIWLWALAVKLMRKARVNYSFVLELDPSTSLSEHHVCAMAAFNTFLWLLFTLLYVGQAQGQIKLANWEAEVWVKAYVYVWLFFQFLPIGFCSPWPTRLWIFKGILCCICAPFFTVTFAHNFIGDYLTSGVKALIDFQYTVCYLATDFYPTLNVKECATPTAQYFLTGLPLYFRMMQCARRYHDTRDASHMCNFGKYAVALLAVCSGAIWPHYRTYADVWTLGHILNIALLATSTVYAYTWDILKDWGLFIKKQDGTWGYRHVVYRHKHMIVFSALTNLIGRCAWMYTIMVAPPGTAWQKEVLTLMTAVVELYRRSQWSLLRIGNEHFNNAAKYRAVTAAPLTFSDGTTVHQKRRESAGERVSSFLRRKSDTNAQRQFVPPALAAFTPVPPTAAALASPSLQRTGSAGQNALARMIHSSPDEKRSLIAKDGAYSPPRDLV